MRIILFDGECNFCDKSVQFIIKRDRDGVFQFASQQSEVGQRLLLENSIPKWIDSFFLISGEKIYYKSSAALRVCRDLNGFWKVFYLFLVVPKPIRDGVYDFIARNRYKWFGKKENCMLPSSEIRNRFL